MIRLSVASDMVSASVVSLAANRAWVRLERELVPGLLAFANWVGPGRIQLETEVLSIGAVGPDGQRGMTLALKRAGSHESAYALLRFLQVRLRVDPDAYPVSRIGATWWVVLDAGILGSSSDESLAELGISVAEISNSGASISMEEPGRSDAAAADENSSLPPSRSELATGKQPPRIAGHRGPPPPPLDTGRPATTIEGLRDYLNEVRSGVGVYINAPCAYIVAGAPYWGRALRINDRFLQVNTANVIPGLGVRIRCDLTVDLAGVKRAVSVYGIMTQKKDAPPGTMYKAALMVRLNRIDEGDSPGLLLEMLEETRRAKEQQTA